MQQTRPLAVIVAYLPPRPWIARAPVLDKQMRSPHHVYGKRAISLNTFVHRYLCHTLVPHTAFGLSSGSCRAGRHVPLTLLGVRVEVVCAPICRGRSTRDVVTDLLSGCGCGCRASVPLERDVLTTQPSGTPPAWSPILVHNCINDTPKKVFAFVSFIVEA